MSQLTLRQSNRARKGLRVLAIRFRAPRDLAKAIGVSERTIKAALSGRSLGGMKLAQCVARCLSWDLEALLNSKIPIEPSPVSQVQTEL